MDDLSGLKSFINVELFYKANILINSNIRKLLHETYFSDYGDIKIHRQIMNEF